MERYVDEDVQRWRKKTRVRLKEKRKSLEREER
jgi:hypothetical protein